MDASSYFPLFLTLISIFAIVSSIILMGMNGNTLAIGEQNKGSYVPVFIICTILAIWMGMRPITSAFGDTVNYALKYGLLSSEDMLENSHDGEWGWTLLTYFCKTSGFNVNTYFVIVDLIYVITGLMAVKRFVPTSPWIGMLFLVGSAFFFSYGTNGLRNGLACNLTLLFIAYALDERYIPAVIAAVLAISFHKSVALPIAASVAAMTFLRDINIAFGIWCASILGSLFFSSFLTSVITSFGFDDRLDMYLTFSQDNDYVTAGNGLDKGGFRWDFLLFSALPIAYVYYINSKGVRDGWFNALAVTYMLSNSFWIILIRASFSNRFAYLSWFLMPIIFVYPLCNMRAWDNQNQAAGRFLLIYIAMTIVLCTLIF